MKSTVSKASCLFLLITGALLAPRVRSAAEEVDFLTDIAPILETRCWYCHGEDEQESGLRLDRRVNMLTGGDSGLAAIVPGEPEKSYLIELINHVDPDMEMPPDDDKLPEEEIELLTRWIREGAVWPGQMEAVKREKSDHWSFQPVVRPAVPKKAEGQTTYPNPIDAFLSERLAKEGLSYSEPAEPRALIRRASIVLTGLAPTPEETEKFLKLSSANPEEAYLELVERLLNSPHFGERWTQHWLDVIRWAETNGSESNMYRKNAWIYRDYVIRAFNEDKPYDQFLREQIAGDALEQGDATGYLVAGPHVPLATVGQEPSARRQARADRMDEILQTVGASALGLTIGCARCHNHKFDPISITDYYSLSAVFQDIEFGSRVPELGASHPSKLRGKELSRLMRIKRNHLSQMGPWEEDWVGFKEIRFPSVSTDAIRVSFKNKTVRIDELEIFGDSRGKNLALTSHGTVVTSSEDGPAARYPVTRINDGKYGNDSWIVRSDKGKLAEPWVQFEFNGEEQVKRIRLSTNRRNFFDTDYLHNLNALNFGKYRVEVRDQEGNWRKVVATDDYHELNREHSPRQKLLKELQQLIHAQIEQGPKRSFVSRFIEPAKTYVLGRGSPENPRNEVYPAGLSELDGKLEVDAYALGSDRRVAFADWLTDPQHPLTSRVAANRLWHHVFGQGIVKTTSDFGAAGTPPTHPELLDWLAAELVQPTSTADGIDGRPWSMKHLISLMVTSQAFRQASLPRKAGIKKDADSTLLWRFPPKRVEAEVIRDSILQASGVLDRSLGGRSFRIHNVKKMYAQWEVTDNHGPHTWRRMIYQERMRRVDDQIFTAFDFPDCGQVRAKRPVSTTPLQALNLMNSDLVLDQSKRIAERALKETDGETTAALDRCFQLLLGRNPSEPERQEAMKLAGEDHLSLVCRALINSNEFAFLP
ncbi:MAG: PSD1 and planctomycete cytochrome C domain-containing protein [Lacipirellulaceae bacterium]